MIDLNIVLGVLVLHFLGDFVLQSDAMSLGKSKQWSMLTLHVAIYSLCFIGWGWSFVAITFLLHFLTDAITSRITNKLWFIELTPWPIGKDGNRLPKLKVNGKYWGFLANLGTIGDRHYFFVVIGVDQLIHVVTLLWTLKFLELV